MLNRLLIEWARAHLPGLSVEITRPIWEFGLRGIFVNVARRSRDGFLLQRFGA